MTIADELLILQQSPSATNVEFIYKFNFHKNLTTGSKIVLSLPGWSGNPNLKSACNGIQLFMESNGLDNRSDFNVSLYFIGSSFLPSKVTCNVRFTGLNNPAYFVSPSSPLVNAK